MAQVRCIWRCFLIMLLAEMAKKMQKFIIDKVVPVLETVENKLLFSVYSRNYGY